MPKIQEFIVMLTLLGVAMLMSGCYTIVGYPQAMEEGIAESVIEEELVGERIYGHYGSYRPYSCYRDYYDPYYGLLSPRSYYGYYDDYWYYPRRYYGDYYYQYNDNYYAPQRKPETKSRTSVRRNSRPESNKKLTEWGEEKEQSNREIRSRSKADNTVQRSVRKSRSSAANSKKRSVKRENQDEEEK